MSLGADATRPAQWVPDTPQGEIWTNQNASAESWVPGLPQGEIWRIYFRNPWDDVWPWDDTQIWDD